MAAERDYRYYRDGLGFEEPVTNRLVSLLVWLGGALIGITILICSILVFSVLVVAAANSNGAAGIVVVGVVVLILILLAAYV